jgi:hypothetical protein
MKCEQWTNGRGAPASSISRGAKLRIVLGLSTVLVLIVVAGKTWAGGCQRVRLHNNYRQAVIYEIRDGANGTGQSCESNEEITSGKAESGGVVDLPCDGRVGYCFRWRAERESSFGGWYGAVCASGCYRGKTTNDYNF